jgi:hypothetical protein
VQNFPGKIIVGKTKAQARGFPGAVFGALIRDRETMIYKLFR